MNTVTKDFDRSFTEWTDDDIYKLWDLCEEKTPIVKLCQALRRFPDDVIFYLVEQEDMSMLDIPEFGEPPHLQLEQLQKQALEQPFFRLRRELEQRRLFRPSKQDVTTD